ncbi:TPM domain-containing protein [Hymenobacter sp. NST-14]|uniref:TPM domain-containing protein n=1 Tax=Hymenobacter piscis TaxID=2839984 RepID=UPI001C037CA5|nr:TPM domain-containing protein [Hymenobacter piscis]MBT9393175.1 TPM domain-containing protein [Hymenobacter piscis]
MRYFSLLLALWLGLLLPACQSTDPDPAAAAYLTAIPDPKTLSQAYVSDPGHLLRPATVQTLNDTLRALDQAGRAHIDVVLAASIGEETPKTAATALFHRWKIGDAEKDNGLLILLVLDQRRIEFETGYGLEADLPDILCHRIQQRYMVPALRARNYDGAVQAGVAATLRQLRTGSLTETAPADSLTLVQSFNSAGTDAAENASEEYAQAGTSAAPEPAGSWSTAGALALLLSVVLFVGLSVRLAFVQAAGAYRWWLLVGGAGVAGLVLLALFTPWPRSPWVVVGFCYGWLALYVHGYFWRLNRQAATEAVRASRHAQYRLLHRGHHGLGFLRFLFPLGLALYWSRYRRRLHQLRETPYPCPTCATLLHKLDEQADDAHLQPGQVVEERIDSVDYDVWECPQCRHTLTLDYLNPGTDVQRCTQCHHHTAEPRPKRVMEEATTYRAGWGWRVHACAFCGHEDLERYTIAQISTSASGGSSGSSGSSSDSGSSWSSSSGGDSGGGGAGSSW